MQKLLFEIQASLIKYQPPILIPNKQLFDKSKENDIHQGKAKIKDILNIILPPRQFCFQLQGKKQHYVQYVDTDKLKREDVDQLKEKLQGFLLVQKAKKQPICPIRQKIYSQTFDQIIRQVIVDCPERGLMLSRVKNQLLLTVFSYRTLYEESLSFCRKKLSESENGINELQKQQNNLLQKQKQLNIRNSYLLSKKKSIQLKSLEARTIYKQKRQHQIAALKFQQQNLEQFLSTIRQIKQEQARIQKKLKAQNKKSQDSSEQAD